MSIHTQSAEMNLLNRQNIVMDAPLAAVVAAEAKAKADYQEYLDITPTGRITRNGETAALPVGHPYFKGNR